MVRKNRTAVISCIDKTPRSILFCTFIESIRTEPRINMKPYLFLVTLSIFFLPVEPSCSPGKNRNGCWPLWTSAWMRGTSG